MMQSSWHPMLHIMSIMYGGVVWVQLPTVRAARPRMLYNTHNIYYTYGDSTINTLFSAHT